MLANNKLKDLVSYNENLLAKTKKFWQFSISKLTYEMYYVMSRKYCKITQYIDPIWLSVFFSEATV